MYKYIDFWSMEHGAWSMEHGAWSMEHGAWSMEHGAWSIISRHTLCALPYAN